MNDADIQCAVTAAQNGSRDALEAVVQYAQGYVYNMALRMLQRPADAEDAAQEILIKIVTHLGQFRGESAFSTWMYRIATNTLLNLERRDRVGSRLSFEDLSDRLEQSLALADESTESFVENAELVQEVRRNCTLGMLRCLNEDDRIALILDEVIGLPGDEAAAILELTPTVYRKRLSRARKRLVAFVAQQCGIVNTQSPCRCHKHVPTKIRAGLLDPEHLEFTQRDTAHTLHQARRAEDPRLDTTARAIALIQSHPNYQSRLDCQLLIDRLFNGDQLDT